MEYCYKIIDVDTTNCSMKVRFYIENCENTVFQEYNVDLPVTDSGVVAPFEDIHFQICNLTPRKKLNQLYSVYYNSEKISNLTTMTNQEIIIHNVQIASDNLTSLINELLGSTSTSTSTTS